jgi:hypothetical protein
MPGRLQEPIAITEYVTTLAFTATNVPDAAGTAIAIEASSNDYLMPYGGSVVGIGVYHNADLTGGVITWNPTVNGTAKTALGAVTDDTNQGGYAVCDSTKVPFTAGQRLGVKWTKTGTVAPTTTDATIVLYVLVTGVGL